MLMKTLYSLIGLLMALQPPVEQRCCEISGQVLDQRGRPLAKVHVYTVVGLEETFSDSKGYFSFSATVSDSVEVMFGRHGLVSHKEIWKPRLQAWRIIISIGAH